MTAMGATVANVARTVTRRFALDRQVEFWLGALEPSWSLAELRARVVQVVDETHDTRTFVLAPNGRWPGHRAGQFVPVHVEVDGVRTTRCYSLSSAPGGSRVAITVKRVAGGRVSGWMHAHVRRGDVLRLGAPAGEFVLPTPPPDRLLLVSGGSGVTPVMSILRDLAARGAARDVVFVHAARSARDVIFRDELAQLAREHRGLRLALFLDDAPASGPLDAAKLGAAVPDLAARDAFLCGPAGMMDALAPVWTHAGLAHRLKRERFAAAPRPGVAAPAAAEGGARVTLTLARSGRRVEADARGSVLEQLERAGERPAYGCRMGICHTCRCRKRAGVVEDLVTGAVSDEPDQDIRLCVSRARTDLELDR